MPQQLGLLEARWGAVSFTHRLGCGAAPGRWQEARHSESFNTTTSGCLAAPSRAVQRCRGKRHLARSAAKLQHALSRVSEARALDEPTLGFDSIADALVDIAAGRFVVVLDDEDRENEGDLIIAADKATTEAMAFMVEHTSGVLCVGMEGPTLDRLRLPLMVSSLENEEAMYTAFTVTVDAREGITTGISAADRMRTVRLLASPGTRPEQLRRPGHIFPLRYHPGGVLVRPGHTEAAVDLARLAGCFPAGVLSEIVNRNDGSMARTPQLRAFAAAHGLRCITIADLIRYRTLIDAGHASRVHASGRNRAAGLTHRGPGPGSLDGMLGGSDPAHGNGHGSAAPAVVLTS